MIAARHHALALALLAACSLRPYTFDTDTGHASATSSDGTTLSTTTPGPTSTTTASLTSTMDLATGSDFLVGEWRGRYYIADEKDGYEPRFSPCTADLAWNFHSDAVPALCKDYDPNDPSLNLHVAGILHPDGDDADDLAELEVTAILAGPCAIGTCDAPSEWSGCRPWAEVCLGCDTYQQDCPEGQKCAPYSADGAGGWESVRCVPVAPAPGGTDAPCTAEGDGLIGIDTCAKGHLCAHIDPDTEMGKCVPQCTGSPIEPTCPACRTCTIASNGALTLCLPDCTPLLQDCVGSELCIPIPIDPERFICVLDASGDEGQIFDPCEYANACDPGLWCAPPEQASECDPNAPGCCLPFCDLTQPTCPGAGQQCIPWSDPPPTCGNENLGTCRLPP